MRLTLGSRRYAGAVAAAAGMFVAAAAPVSEDTWGCAIVSRLPVLRYFFLLVFVSFRFVSFRFVSFRFVSFFFSLRLCVFFDSGIFRESFLSLLLEVMLLWSLALLLLALL